MAEAVQGRGLWKGLWWRFKGLSGLHPSSRTAWEYVLVCLFSMLFPGFQHQQIQDNDDPGNDSGRHKSRVVGYKEKETHLWALPCSQIWQNQHVLSERARRISSCWAVLTLTSQFDIPDFGRRRKILASSYEESQTLKFPMWSSPLLYFLQAQ